MQYKILFLDIDGTLLNSKGEITPATRSAIAKLQANDIPVVLASGRPFGGMLQLASELNLAQNGGYVVSFNGGKIVNMKTGTILCESFMPLAQVAQVFALTQQLGLAVLTYNETGILAQHPENPYVLHEKTITGLPFVPFDGNAASLTSPVHKCLVVGETQQLIAAEAVFKQQLGEVVAVSRSSPIFLEVMPLGVDKASGISAMLEKLGIPAEAAVACGDGFNDVPMLRLAGVGAVLANAPDGVKAEADLLVGSNDEDGVAQAIAHCWGDLL